MVNMRKTLICGGLVLAAVTGPAFADHGKAGLWQIKTDVEMTGAKPMHQSFVNQHCMTAQEVKDDAFTSQNKDCKITNVQSGGGKFSADMTCSGEVRGAGHLTVAYDSPEHYTGQLSMTSEAGGATTHTTNRFEGNWVSASCGKVTQ